LEKISHIGQHRFKLGAPVIFAKRGEGVEEIQTIPPKS